MSFARIADLPGAVRPNHWLGNENGLSSVEPVLRGEEERCSHDDIPNDGRQFVRFVLLIENFKRAIGYQNAFYLVADQHLRAHSLPRDILEYLTGESNPNLTFSKEALERAHQFDRQYKQIGNSGDGWAGIIHCYEDLKTMLLENQSNHTVSKAVKTAKNKFVLEAISEDDSENAYQRIMKEVSAVTSDLINPELGYEPICREIYLAKRIPPANAIILQASKLGYGTRVELVEQGAHAVGLGRRRLQWRHVLTMNSENSDVTDLTFVDKALITEKIASISISIVFDKVKLAHKRFDPQFFLSFNSVVII